MTLQPDEQQTIFDRVKAAIASKTPITNFSDESPEKAIADDVFAAELRERQHELLAVQLSGRQRFAGKGADGSEDPIDADDLAGLGVDTERIDFDLLNEFVDSEDLDALARRKSLSRDPGSFAEGTVTFQTTSDGIVIPEGTTVTTEPDADGSTIDFETTAEVTPSTGSTSVDADVRAVERGTRGNVGSGTLIQLPDPPPGVVGNPPVSNAASTTGGEDAETNAELRERASRALTRTAGGGTVEGVEGAIVETFDGLDLEDVDVRENPTANPQDFDVVVDGGPSDADLQSEINRLQPVAVDGVLVRPTKLTVDVTVDVTGTSIDPSSVQSAVVSLLEGLGIGTDLIRDQLIAEIVTADAGVNGISTLSVSSNGSSVADDLAVGNTETVEAGTISVNVV